MTQSVKPAAPPLAAPPPGSGRLANPPPAPARPASSPPASGRLASSPPEDVRRYGGQSALARRAERRERLLDAGLDLFGTLGYAGTSIERLCTAAAVSTRNFYEEFGGREPLLLALHDRVMQRAVHAVTDALIDRADAPVTERIEAAFRAYVSTTAGDPRWARLAYVEVIGVSAAVERNRAAWRDRWAALLVAEAQRAAARGEAAGRDYGLTAVAVVGALYELVRHWSLEPEGLPLDAVIAEITTLVEAVVTFPAAR
jgi:AcrR family transcriptional regulator